LTEALCDYLGYGELGGDDDIIRRNLERALTAADAYLKGRIHEDYDSGDPLARQLLIEAAAKIYEHGSAGSARNDAAFNRIISSGALQLKMAKRGGA
jgi:N-acetylglucosamine kinase-like BadF-type ATPase